MTWKHTLNFFLCDEVAVRNLSNLKNRNIHFWDNVQGLSIFLSLNLSKNVKTDYFK